MSDMDRIDNTEDILDSRDVEARITYLERWEDEDDPDLFDEDEREELAALRALRDEATDYTSDWRYGEALIRDSYFVDYVKEFAEDMHGSAVSDAKWPFNCIDWDEAADEFKVDYTEINFDGESYWVRNS